MKQRKRKPHPNYQGDEDFRDKDPAVYEQRAAFLQAASDHERIKLGDSLLENVHRRILEEPKKYANEAETNKLMWNWAARFNLGAYWVIGMCWNALSAQRVSPKKKLRFESVVIYSPPPAFQLPVWDMREEEARYIGRVNQMLASALDGYIADSKRKRSSYPITRSRSGPVKTRYAYAALKVCLGLSYEQIAGMYGVTPQSVSQLVAGICERIGLST